MAQICEYGLVNIVKYMPAIIHIEIGPVSSSNIFLRFVLFFSFHGKDDFVFVVLCIELIRFCGRLSGGKKAFSHQRKIYTVKFHYVTLKHLFMFFKLQFSVRQLVV
jgi:hypothetical protein